MPAPEGKKQESRWMLQKTKKLAFLIRAYLQPDWHINLQEKGKRACSQGSS